MKSVLISIKPKYVELIANGQKTIKVHKTRPKIDTPFKCYIYCTKGTTETPWVDEDGHFIFKGRGQVIGEFVCDCVDEFLVFENGSVQYWNYHKLDKSCLTYEELSNYIGKGKKGYSWHISDLVIYDEPKELSEFIKHYCPTDDCRQCKYFEAEYNGYFCGSNLTRPPKSWCYVEGKE